MKNYIGYVRVSTKTQLEGNGLDIQIQAIKDYCKENGINLQHIYSDNGISAVAERRAFKKAISRILNDEDIDGLIVYDLMRFGRSMTEIYINMNMITKKEKEVVIVKNNLIVKKDMDTMSKAFLGFLAVFAEYERNIIAERMAAGKERAKIKGTKSGKPMHRPKKYIDWKKVKELREYGLSWSKTAKHVGVTPATLISRAREEGYYEKFNRLADENKIFIDD